MLRGYEEEDAVLLCHYFLYFGHSSWVVLEIAVSEGSQYTRVYIII